MSSYKRHIIIPDTQVRPGVRTDHLLWAGKYIRDMRPDVVVHLGDHWDMASLSSYDRGKKSFEGRRYKADIEAGNAAMRLLNAGMGKLATRKVFLKGNHEDRITRAVENDAVMEGTVTHEDFDLKGWEVHNFLSVVQIHGVAYSHYFYNPRNSKPWTGTAANILKHVGQSFVMGHRQGLDVGLQQLPLGGRRRAVIAGSFYQHDETYLGPQGDHWRGILMLNEVKDGDFDVCEVSLDYLRRKYG